MLINLSDNAEESDFFKTHSLNDIFDRYVNVSGYETRISDFRVGPFVCDNVQDYKSPKVDFGRLEKNEALILIERSNDFWIKIYQVLENSAVKASKFEQF